ncbi:hypothetical protein BX666DRAFT_327804 [Dichotomocladium elegans]|nr:hypothetical protein BX666DRAFT_327804 [Dichotomocladium elegans]
MHQLQSAIHDWRQGRDSFNQGKDTELGLTIECMVLVRRWITDFFFPIRRKLAMEAQVISTPSLILLFGPCLYFFFISTSVATG